MKISNLILSILLVGICVVSCTNSAVKKPNILFIAVDDLRPQLNCYGDTNIISPNIDRLADEGVLFSSAYCQVPICMATRSSLMTGFRPDHNNLYNCQSVQDLNLQDYTLNKHFEKNGYDVWATGKIYHYEEDSKEQFGEEWENLKLRWYGRGYITEEAKRIVDEYPTEFAKYRKKDAAGRGPAYEIADVPDSAYYDGYRTNMAIHKLKEFQKSTKPFFLAVGYKKPHLPFNAPKKYWDNYKEDKIELADNPFLPQNYTDYTKYNFNELRNYYGIPKNDTPLPDDLSKKLIHGYYACVSFIDAQIGKLMDELEYLNLKENTIVVLWGDHGWKLGEHGMWCKHTTFELDCRVPLIISYPSKLEGYKNVKKFVELVDIYPTLCDLAELELPVHLEGNSLVPIIKNSNHKWKEAVFTQWPKYSRQDPEEVITGYSVKINRYRYTEWTKNKNGEILERELYDHLSDPKENSNVASIDKYQYLVDSLSTILDGGKGWKNFSVLDRK